MYYHNYLPEYFGYKFWASMKQKSSCPYTKSILWLIILSGIPSVYVKRWINAWFNIFFKLFLSIQNELGEKTNPTTFANSQQQATILQLSGRFFLASFFAAIQRREQCLSPSPFLHCLAKIQSKPALIFDKNINYFLHSYVSFKKNHHKTLWNSIYDL